MNRNSHRLRSHKKEDENGKSGRHKDSLNELEMLHMILLCSKGPHAVGFRENYKEHTAA